MPKRKAKASQDAQPKKKKLKIEVKERKEGKEVPIEENEDEGKEVKEEPSEEDEHMEDEKPAKKPRKKYIGKVRPIDGNPYSNFLCKKFLSLFGELKQKRNPGIDLAKIKCGSNKTLVWECRDHSSCKKHVWKAKVNDRVRGRGCPYCCTVGGNKRWCPCDRPSFLNEDGSFKRGKDNMKRCTKCMAEKPNSEFNGDKRSKDGFYCWCKECSIKAHKDDYSVRSATMRLFLQGKCCQDCLERDVVLLEFDHVNNDKARSKKGNIRSMIELYPSQMCMEFKKTEIVCIRCHRLRTHSRHQGKAVDSKAGALKRQLVRKLKMERKCCFECKTNISKDEIRLFDCDHINHTTKIAAVSKMINQNEYTMKDVEEEVAKCQLLCCKCHRLKTAKELKWRKLSNFSEEEVAKARKFLDQHFQKDAQGHYIHVNPVKIEVLRIHDKPQKLRKIQSSNNLRELMVALSNQKAVSKNAIIIKPN